MKQTYVIHIYMSVLPNTGEIKRKGYFKGIINHNLLSSENPGTIMLAMLKKGSFTWTDGRLNEDREGGPGRWVKEKRVEIQMDARGRVRL